MKTFLNQRNTFSSASLVFIAWLWLGFFCLSYFIPKSYLPTWLLTTGWQYPLHFVPDTKMLKTYLIIKYILKIWWLFIQIHDIRGSFLLILSLCCRRQKLSQTCSLDKKQLHPIQLGQRYSGKRGTPSSYYQQKCFLFKISKYQGCLRHCTPTCSSTK